MAGSRRFDDCMAFLDAAVAEQHHLTAPECRSGPVRDTHTDHVAERGHGTGVVEPAQPEPVPARFIATALATADSLAASDEVYNLLRHCIDHAAMVCGVESDDGSPAEVIAAFLDACDPEALDEATLANPVDAAAPLAASFLAALKVEATQWPG